MRAGPDNPSANQLGAGVDEGALKAAVAASGHPLQAAVIDCLTSVLSPRGRFFAQEEWSYVDTESGEVRAIDALGELSMWENDARGMNPRIRPVLNLVIECKQSELPYVFFLREGGSRPDYPRIVALPHSKITFTTDDDPSTYTFDVLDALGIGFHPFVTSSSPTAISLSRVVRKGRDLVVTGEESYRGLTLPLLKATDHLVSSCRPSRSRYFFDARLIVSLAVIRATMVGVLREGQSDNLEAVPWVRVHHLLPSAPQDQSVASVQAFDVVHESYLQTYLQKLLEFAEEFATRSQKATSVLLAGRGFSSGLGHQGFPSEIMPMTAMTRRIKARLYAESLWMHLTRRVPPYGEYLRPPLSKRGVTQHKVGEDRKSP